MSKTVSWEASSFCAGLSSARCPGSCRRLQHQFLYPPRFDFADDDLVRIPTVHHMHHLETAEFFAWVSEFPEDRAVEFQFVDFTGNFPCAGSVAVRVRVRSENVLVRTL